MLLKKAETEIEILEGDNLLQDKSRIKSFIDAMSSNGNDEQGSSIYSKNIFNY